MANTTGKKYGGRVKGTPNRATKESREAIADFVEGNVDRLEKWLDQIAEDNPKQAFDSFMSVVEYHIPKLQRVESTNENLNVDVKSLQEEDLRILHKIGYYDEE
jgi:vacuolar-type H+-ATPase subunit E/Vma4